MDTIYALFFKNDDDNHTDNHADNHADNHVDYTTRKLNHGAVITELHYLEQQKEKQYITSKRSKHPYTISYDSSETPTLREAISKMCNKLQD